MTEEIQPPPEGRGAEGRDPAGAGTAPGADRRVARRLRRPLGVARLRPPRGVPAEPRRAGRPGDLPSGHVRPRPGGDRLPETVPRGRARGEAVRSVEKRPRERPRRGRRRARFPGRGGGRRPPRDPGRGGAMDRSRDPGDGARGAFRRARHRTDAGTAPGGPVLSPGGLVSPDGAEDGAGGDGRGSGAGGGGRSRREKVYAETVGAAPPPGRGGPGAADRIGRGPGSRLDHLGAVAGRGRTGPEGTNPRGRTPGG